MRDFHLFVADQILLCIRSVHFIRMVNNFYIMNLHNIAYLNPHNYQELIMIQLFEFEWVLKVHINVIFNLVTLSY